MKGTLQKEWKVRPPINAAMEFWEAKYTNSMTVGPAAHAFEEVSEPIEDFRFPCARDAVQHKAQWFGSEHLIVDLIVALLKTTVDDSAEYRSLPVVGGLDVGPAYPWPERLRTDLLTTPPRRFSPALHMPAPQFL